MDAKNSIQASLEKARRRISDKARELGEAVERFRFEGRASRKANAARSERLLKEFGSALSAHGRLEERKLFPYITRRIPRLEVLLYFFGTEHAEFQSQIRRLKVLLRISGASRAPVFPMRALEEARLEAMRLVAQVDAHLRQEDDELYRVIDSEFHPNEKRALRRLARAAHPSPGAKNSLILARA